MDPSTPTARSASARGDETPSPASTYGVTVAGGDSLPSTPVSAEFEAKPEHLSSKEGGLVKVFTDSQDDLYVYSANQNDASNIPESRLGVKSYRSSDSSPAKLMDMVDEASPGANAGNKPFVQGADCKDDVFTIDTTSEQKTTTIKSDAHELTLGSQGQNPHTDPEDTSSTASPSFSPREDRRGQMVTADNAQAHYKPEACVFVANLPNIRSDSELVVAATDIFSQFGECHVKVKRDRGMPLAFVQYHNAEDATSALERGAGLPILGRKCRTERGKAPRCVYVSRRDGKTPSLEEIRLLFLNHGQLETLWSPTETEREVHGLRAGYFVRFVYYQDSVEAVVQFRDNPKYHVVSYPSPKHRISVFDRSSQQHHPNAALHFNPAKHDNQVLWVGNLPDTVTKAELATVFGGQGRQIAYIDLRTRQDIHSGNRSLGYACIHYSDPQSAHRAAYMTHNSLRLNDGRLVLVQYARKPQPLHPSMTSHTRTGYGGYGLYNGHSGSHVNYGLPGSFVGRGFRVANGIDGPARYDEHLNRNDSQPRTYASRTYRTNGGFHDIHGASSGMSSRMELFPMSCPTIEGGPYLSPHPSLPMGLSQYGHVDYSPYQFQQWL